MEAEKRKEQRISIDVINLPFLGSKEEDHLCFQYLLTDVGRSGVRIAIPKWVVNRELIRKGDIINFQEGIMDNKTKPDKSLQAEDRGQKRVAAGSRRLEPADFSLRKNAEDHLMKSKAKSEVFGDTQRLIHELQVHQIELEMQNEELRKAQQELQASRDNYFDFYNFSPVGYFTFDEKGLILDLNLTSATLLGMARQELIRRSFRLYISPDFRPVFNAFCKKILEADTKQDCELKLDASAHVVLMEGISVPDADGHGKSIRAVMVDIKERKEMEEKLRKGKVMFEKAMKDTFHVLMSTIEQRMAQAPKKRQRVVETCLCYSRGNGYFSRTNRGHCYGRVYP